MAVCIGVLLVMAIPVSAEAGAWTKRKHEGLFISGFSFHWLDPSGQPESRGSIKLESSVYLEYGLTDRLTVIGRGGVQQLHHRGSTDGTVPRRAQAGIGGLELGTRVQVLQQGRWASSIQVTVGIPGSGENWINEEFGDLGGDIDMRLQVGRSVAGRAFISMGTGVRLRGQRAADEIRMDLTAGTHLVWGTQAMVQSYSVWAMGGNRARPAYTGHRLQASLLVPYGLAGTDMLQVSVLRTINQQRMSDEFAVLASVWRSF